MELDVLYNVSISVIAAVIFFVVQVYLVNKKRDDILKKYAKRYVKDKKYTEEVIDKMNGLLFDNFFYMVEIRAKGYLKNESMLHIINDGNNIEKS